MRIIALYFLLLLLLFTTIVKADEETDAEGRIQNIQENLQDNIFLENDSYSKVEYFSNGIINWTKGFCLGVARETDLDKLTKKKLKKAFIEINARNDVQNELVHKAKTNLLNIILNTRVDKSKFVKDYFEENKDFRELFLLEIEKNIMVLPTHFKNPRKVSVAVKYPLYGKNGLENLIYKLDDNVEKAAFLNDKKVYNSPPYSSIIVDLRKSYNLIDNVYTESIFLPENITFPDGLQNKVRYEKNKKKLVFRGIMDIEEKKVLMSIFPNNELYKSVVEELYKKSKNKEKKIKANPALFPIIYDSRGYKIYSKNLIEKEKRSKEQFVHYTKDRLILYKIEMVGENPLYTIADKIIGQNNTNIIIGQEDCNKIFSNPRTIENIKQGKIFLLVD